MEIYVTILKIFLIYLIKFFLLLLIERHFSIFIQLFLFPYHRNLSFLNPNHYNVNKILLKYENITFLKIIDT